MFSTFCDLSRSDTALRPRQSADSQPRWIHLPIAAAQLLSPHLELTRYCETMSHQGKRRIATTFHAIINVPGEPDRAWFACAECTSLMMQEGDPTAA